MQNSTIWHNCKNEELLEILHDCPEIVEELKKIGYQDWVNSYDAILPNYNMDRVTTPIYRDNTDEVEYFGYWYRIDGIEYGMKEDQKYKTKAEAQLASIKETMAELRNRIVASRNK
ncbi:MAG: hypothetical protein J6X58_05810 [Bacteroidales bacterium]|nr:hypothetical protein [Bacteroidales bacterium]